MQKNYILTILSLAFVLNIFGTLNAQTDEQNFIFRVNSPSGIAADYDWSGSTDWGAMVTETVTADLAWAYDDVDSLMCSSTATNDLTGKIALIRRGACNFSLKAYNAQEGGAIGFIICNNNEANPTELVGMLGGDSATAVVIPGIFLSFQTCSFIADEIASGNTVNASFLLPTIYNELGPYSYHTPQSQILPLDEIQMNVVNRDTMNVATGVECKVEVLEPGGTTTVLTQTLDIPPSADTVIQFDDYIPSDLGEYVMTYSAEALTDDVLEHRFVITDATYALDNGDLANAGGASETDAGFLNAGLQFHMGSVYLAGPNGGTATYATFAIHNPEEFASGTPADDEFQILLYDADPDGDGVIPGGTSSYDDFTVIAFASYQLESDYQADQLITVEFDGPATLNPNGQYLLSVQYDGSNNGSGISPDFTTAGAANLPYIGTTVFGSDGDANPPRLFMGGFTSGINAVIRLQMDNFVNTENITELADNKLTVYPTIANNEINVQLNLDGPNNVQIRMFDFQSRLVNAYEYNGVQRENITLDVSALASGLYFLAVETEEGYRAVKFNITK